MKRYHLKILYLLYFILLVPAISPAQDWLEQTGAWLEQAEPEWAERFQEKLTEEMNTGRFSRVALRAVLENMSPRGFSADPGEAALQFKAILKNTDESVRRGENIARLSAALRQMNKERQAEGAAPGGGRGKGKGKGKGRSKALERIREARENPGRGVPGSPGPPDSVPGKPEVPRP
jgi:hypothetical protein